MKPVRVGCSGWNYQSWRASFYPQGCPPSRWLQRYSEAFDTVEVNSTFYRLASRDAVARWVEQTPPDFLFTLKASRYLTHIKRLTNLDTGIAKFYERVEPLTTTPKMGPVLWQLPENFHRDDDRLGAALEALPAGRHTFEFRHKSWFTEEVYALLREHGVALTIGDHPERPFQSHEMTAAWTFVRFHYGHRGRRGNYAESELEAWAERFERWREEVEILVYFNNDWEEFAIRNGLWMRRRLDV